MNKLKARGRQIRKIIADVREMDLNLVSVDDLRPHLKPLLVGLRFSSPTWQIGQIFFRGRTMSSRPTRIQEMSYPPAATVKSLQRANRPGTPMFYCSLHRDPVFFELRVKPGDMVALSRWRTSRKMMTCSIGFTEASFHQMGSKRQVPDWASAAPFCPAYQFFSEEFTRKIVPGNEATYKISVALAENIYDLTWNPDIEAVADDIKNAGIHFPSVAMFGNSDNFALYPAFVDEHMIPTFIEWIRIDEVLDGPIYRVSRVDFSDAFSPDGTIKWAERAPKTIIHPGESVLARVENGVLVFRDDAMKLIGYSVD